MPKVQERRPSDHAYEDGADSASSRLSWGERVKYMAVLFGATAVGAFPIWGNALFKPGEKEVEAAYAKVFRPATERIGSRALKLSEGPDALFDRSPRTRFRRTRISADVPNKFGNEARVVIEMGQTNGKPDPRKVSSMFLQQPQGGGVNAEVKTVEITAPRNVTPDVFGEEGAWSGEEREFTSHGGVSQGQDNFIEGTTAPSDYPNILDDVSNGLYFDYGAEMGQAQPIADDAERMFSQIVTALQHKPGQGPNQG